MHPFLRSFTVRRPLADVWAYVADMCNYEDWHPMTLTVHRIAGDGGLGSTYRRVSVVSGQAVEMDFSVVKHQPAVSVSFHGLAPGREIIDTIGLQARPNEVQVVRNVAGRGFETAQLDVVAMEAAADMSAVSLRDSLLQL